MLSYSAASVLAPFGCPYPAKVFDRAVCDIGYIACEVILTFGQYVGYQFACDTALFRFVYHDIKDLCRIRAAKGSKYTAAEYESMCNDLEETAKEERSVSTLATNLPVILRFLGSFTMIF